MGAQLDLRLFDGEPVHHKFLIGVGDVVSTIWDHLFKIIFPPPEDFQGGYYGDQEFEPDFYGFILCD
jgi:hypothetical protein